LSPSFNHRVIEEKIPGAAGTANRAHGRTFHRTRPSGIDDGALAVHGICAPIRDGQPRFADIAEELIAFLAGAEL